jgi:nucleoside 2-deoxyribosyltransferase
VRACVVLCGSFHREPDQLRRLFRELEATGCRVLSPISLHFNTDAEFVKAQTETDLSTAEIEKFHLRAIRDADFIMLHAPNGNIGISATYELGFSGALGKPVFALQQPRDEMLATRIQVVCSVFEALDRLQLTSF